MRRSGGGYRHNHRHGGREWSVKAIGDDTPQEGEEGRQVYHEFDRASTSTPPTSDQQQTSGQTQKIPNGNPNPNFSLRNRGSNKVRARVFSKSNAGSSSLSDLGHMDHEVVEPGVDNLEKEDDIVPRNFAPNATKPRFSEEPEVGSSSQSELRSLDEAVETLDGEANSLSTEVGNCDDWEEDKKIDRSEICVSNIQAVVDPRSDSGKREDDVFARLEELLSVVDEPELSEEQLRLNDQLQEDELLVMQSIYGEYVFVIERHKDLRVFQIHIHLECSDEVSVTAKMDSSDDPNVKSGGSSDFSYPFVRYHPPIILTCMLPQTYPSHLPPYFVISVKWLDSTMISELCLMLDSIWSEQMEQEVIYQWSDWLQNSSLSYLGFNKGIVLGSYCATKVEDSRCFSGRMSPMSVVRFPRSYNAEKWHANFHRSLHDCVICFSEYSGEAQISYDQKRRERNMINEILSMREVLQASKQCPSCNMAISRIEGCNKMVCSKKFCYLCNKAIDGYNHFRDGTCEMFSEEVIQAWEHRMNGRQAVAQM